MIANRVNTDGKQDECQVLQALGAVLLSRKTSQERSYGAD